jgi:hypothetical protein
MTTARDLSNQLADLLRREHVAMADFLVALSDFHHKGLWMDLGYPSLFYYLHRELGLSKGAAAYRKTAAELVQRFPEIVEPLRDGRLCITSIVELARVISPENAASVLPRFFHRSKREAMEVVAELQPAAVPPLRTVVTTVAPAREVAAAPALARAAPELPLASAPSEQPAPGGRLADLPDANSGATPQNSSPEVKPLTAELRRFHLTVSKKFLEKLSTARDALAHSMPGATEEEILEAGLDLVLAAHAKRKGLVEKPRKTPPPSTSDHIPAHVKRAVWERDGGRCAYPIPGAGVCGSTHKVEFDHLVARALGGRPTVENLALRCRAHNLANARETFGDALMDVYTRNPRTPPDRVREPVAGYGPRLDGAASLACG